MAIIARLRARRLRGETELALTVCTAPSFTPRVSASNLGLGLGILRRLDQGLALRLLGPGRFQLQDRNIVDAGVGGALQIVADLVQLAHHHLRCCG